MHFVDNGKTGARWKCRCDCGKIKVIDGYLLRRGSVKTCGCRINININLTGNKYGKLTALKEIGRHKDRCILWECKCDCGEIISVKARSLKRGETKSCGCLRRIQKGEANFNKLLANYKQQAKLRKLDFCLSKENFRNLTQQNCFYCGAPPLSIKNRKYSNGVYKCNGIDRKDNNEGYTISNAVSCCLICNRAKSNLSYQEFLQWIQRVKTK